MYTNLYLAENLGRQRQQDFVDQAARDRTAAQVSKTNATRSQTMKRIKLIAVAIIVAATLLGAAPRALTTYDGSVPAVASMCCWGR